MRKNYHWQMDVAFMQDIKGYNYQLQYWLVVVDVYSRFIWVKLMKKFEEILQDPNVDVPVKIQTDEGGEFEKIKKLSNVYGFALYHTYNREIKASIVEAMIETLKLMVQRTIGVTKNNIYKSDEDYRCVQLFTTSWDWRSHTKGSIQREKKCYLQYKSHFWIAKLAKVIFKPGDRVCVALTKKHLKSRACNVGDVKCFLFTKFLQPIQ